ncbi:cullin-associated NEDD8-dissociated protein 1 isoform X2 [Diorhabda carinulata]|uniref:cullin-associated NEDD8-dissociated protein 1 isoform X2 n=1 Tax=Diorhabda carinulata TaxID=1163345 RepID=UPI00259FED82|nr:cullin-associated NEDD8-dissociated protein 1 isoform X2 [Diorhabda carinulata]
MASVSYQIANLLEKMTSSDKDFRFMATNDLMTELQKDSIKLDDDSERKVVRMLLKLLEDKNGEVQNLAVKCLGPLVNKVKEYQVETIVESLCTNMVSDKEQLRDISSIGLKTVIAELPQATGGLSGNICKRITGRLTTAIERQEDVSVQLEALDIITDLLLRFGPVLQAFHGSILTALLPQLCSQRQAVRKRTISACSNLVLSCNNTLYTKLIEHLYDGLCSDKNSSQVRTYVQCVAAVCRQSGHKFGENIEKFVPLILECSQVDDDELREFCLQAFESFINRCPKEISKHILSITELCLKYMVYDPNYNYDEDESANGENDPYDDDEEDEENDEYSDDDDMSWKVRRSAAKCLEAIISTRHELLPEFYKVLSPALIARFKEREENVKSDIFHAYIALLKQTRSTVNVNLDPNAMVMDDEEETAMSLLQQQIELLVKGVQGQMREKSIKTRQDCFQLLKEVCTVLPGALSTHIGELIPGILYSLSEKNASSNMKIDALSFIYCLLTSHQPQVFHPYISILLPPVINAVGDNFYKITAEALNVLQELVKVIRPLNTSPRNSEFDFTPFTKDIYSCTLLRLRTADIDQEVKEKAISTMGQVICNLGDHLKTELPHCLPLFLDRLKNEITRLTTVKALTKIAGSPLEIELPILPEAMPILGLFLRKNQRALKLTTLQLINCLITNYHDDLNETLLHPIVVEIPPLLDESDLHIAQWTLIILKSIAVYHPRALQNINDTIMPQIMVLVKSPLLQGTALQSMLDFFKALVQSNLPGLNYDSLLRLLLMPIMNLSSNSPAALHKQAFYSLAKCVAAITVTFHSHALPVIPQFINEIQTASTDSKQIFALLVVGEIGREIDLTSIPNLKQVIFQSFSALSEEVKSAASYALGSICIGNLQQYLPFILKESQDQPKRQYLLLHSLKEVITCLSQTPEGINQLLPFVTPIWQQLYRHCECVEEGTRNVVAECLGKLTLIDPTNVLPKLKRSLNSPSPLTRTTVVTAVKFTISDQATSIDPLLRLCIGEFLNTLQDPDLNVRRVALVAFNTAAHNKPSLIRDLLDTTLPQLYGETIIKRDLIREVEMGPFKHTVDDGLDIRKAAYECMYTLLDSCLDKVDIFEFINHVETGLKDHYDIKMLTYLMVARLSQICPGAVYQMLDKLVEPLRATLTMKVKANSVKQEYEKQDELKKSAMRAVAALLRIPDADKNPHLNEFVSQIKGSQDLAPIFESVQKDSSSSHSDCLLMDQS